MSHFLHTARRGVNFFSRISQNWFWVIKLNFLHKFGFLGHFGSFWGGVKKIFQLSPAFRICTGCLPKYGWDLLKIGFKNTYFQVFQAFPVQETVAHIHPNGQFWTVFGQNGQNRIFFKKALGTFFPPLQALTNCKVSEKSNERFLSNRVMYGRTYGRTDIRNNVNP